MLNLVVELSAGPSGWIPTDIDFAIKGTIENNEILSAARTIAMREPAAARAA
jgi:hypothetical protein